MQVDTLFNKKGATIKATPLTKQKLIENVTNVRF